MTMCVNDGNFAGLFLSLLSYQGGSYITSLFLSVGILVTCYITQTGGFRASSGRFRHSQEDEWMSSHWGGGFLSLVPSDPPVSHS